jgi:hypothetical protein
VENRSLAQISVSLTALSPAAVEKELRQQLVPLMQQLPLIIMSEQE